MKRASLVLLGLVGTAAVHAQEIKDEPPLPPKKTLWEKIEFQIRSDFDPPAADKEWERGAGVAYVAKGDKKSEDIDAALRIAYEWDSPGPTKSDWETSFRHSASFGPYWHRLRGADKPESDRGLAASYSARFLWGDGSASVRHLLASLTYKDGKKLTEGTKDFTGQFFKINTQRLLASLGWYFQPVNNTFYVDLAAGAYKDEQSGSYKTESNGRLAGAQVSAQFNFYPAGILPQFRFGNSAVAPKVWLKGQRQWDQSSSLNRIKRNRNYWEAAITFPFTSVGDNKKLLVPSVEIKRSYGADLLIGQEENIGTTSVGLNLKF